MRFVLSVLAFLFLASCATVVAEGPVFTSRPNDILPEDGKSRVVIYRIIERKGGASIAPIVDNGEKVGAINVGGYISYLTEPGIHRIHTETIAIDEILSIDMAVNRIYFLRINFDIGTFNQTLSFEIIPEEIALTQLKSSKYQGK